MHINLFFTSYRTGLFYCSFQNCSNLARCAKPTVHTYNTFFCICLFFFSRSPSETRGVEDLRSGWWWVSGVPISFCHSLNLHQASCNEITFYGAVHLVTTYFGQWLCMHQISNQNFWNFFLAWDENLFFKQLRNDSKNPRNTCKLYRLTVHARRGGFWFG